MMMLQVTNISTFNETELGGTYLVSSISKKRTDLGLRQIMYGKYQTTHHSKWWPDLTLLNLLLYTSISNSSTLGVGQENVICK